MCQQTGPKHRQAVHKSPAGSVNGRLPVEHKLADLKKMEQGNCITLSVGGGHSWQPHDTSNPPLPSLLCSQETLQSKRLLVAEITRERK
ncbi:hypothetical protein Hamer_G026656 [Homarus americanus]|uniref:Uncharacterized protein n=1 Tax=Homarus americanus TaxID=6706 RepID=A0A8J5N1T7_HOMAM|nr:hypothetical protein Hamer_G026656 [Homarus americanus]